MKKLGYFMLIVFIWLLSGNVSMADGLPDNYVEKGCAINYKRNYNNYCMSSEYKFYVHQSDANMPFCIFVDDSNLVNGVKIYYEKDSFDYPVYYSMRSKSTYGNPIDLFYTTSDVNLLFSTDSSNLVTNYVYYTSYDYEEYSPLNHDIIYIDSSSTPVFNNMDYVNEYLNDGNTTGNLNDNLMGDPVYDDDSIRTPIVTWYKDPVSGKLTWQYDIQNATYFEGENHEHRYQYDVEAEYKFKAPNFFIVQDANKLGTSTYTIGYEGLSATGSFPVEAENDLHVNLKNLANYSEAKAAAQQLLTSATYQYRNSSGDIITDGMTHFFLEQSSSQVRNFDSSPYVVPYVILRFKKQIGNEMHYSKPLTIYMNLPDQVVTYNGDNQPIDKIGDQGGSTNGTDTNTQTSGTDQGFQISTSGDMKLSDYSAAFDTVKGMFNDIQTLPQYIGSVISLCPQWLINLIYAGIGFALIIAILKLIF